MRSRRWRPWPRAIQVSPWTRSRLLAIGPGQDGGDFRHRASNLINPASGLAERVWGRDATVTLNGHPLRYVAYAAAAAATFTLPTVAESTPVHPSVRCDTTECLDPAT